MASIVLDACALIALAKKEEGSAIVASFLENEENSCFAHSVNLCEVYYKAYRDTSKQEAIALVEGFLDLGVILRDDMDTEFWQDAGELKAVHKRVSLADCCAIALANRLNAELVTSDHHELDDRAEQNMSARSRSLDRPIAKSFYSPFTIHDS